MQAIAHDDLQTMLENRSDVSLVEVLSAEKFNEFHLPGATMFRLTKSLTSESSSPCRRRTNR